MKTIVVNGPNLNLLGKREVSLYGKSTLKGIENHLLKVGDELDEEIICYQNNHEGNIIDYLHRYLNDKSCRGFIINLGAYTHTSIAIRDALLALDKGFVEVHLTNVYKRESFRCSSYFSDEALAVISGLGVYGYEAALRYLVGEMKK